MKDPEQIKTVRRITDAVPTRSDHDRTIPVASWHYQSDAMYCNGNGACFNYDPIDTMCPSWKGTRERKHSPKGRASLIREWVRILGVKGANTQDLAQAEHRRLPLLHWFPWAWNTLRQRQGQYDFSHEVYDSMAGCLACKSCDTFIFSVGKLHQFRNGQAKFRSSY